MVAGGSSGFAAAWSAQAVSDSYYIYAARLENGTWQEPTRLPGQPSENVNPRMTLYQGQPVVAWTKPPNDSGDTHSSYFARKTDSGWQDAELAIDLQGYQVDMGVGADNGKVTLLAAGEPGSVWAFVEATDKELDGEWASSEQLMYGDHSAHQDLAVNSSGRALAVYIKETDDGVLKVGSNIRQ